MFIVKFYTIQLVVFSGFCNSYAMVDRNEKHPQQQYRQDRQIRPVLNSIIFLIAANLVAKGALGLGTYQNPLPANIQGSLFLTLNSPQGANIPPQYVPVLYPVGPTGQPGSSTPAPRPVAQTQVINIGEPFEEVQDLTKNDPYTQKLFINRFNSIEDPLDTSSSEEVTVKTKSEETTETNTELTTQLNTEQNSTDKNKELVELARQNQPPSTTSTTTPVPRTTTATAVTEPDSSTFPLPTQGAVPANGTSNTGYILPGSYGPPNTGYILPGSYGPPNTGYILPGDYGLPDNGYFLPDSYGPPNTGYIRPSYGPPNVGINTGNMSVLNGSTNNTASNGTGYYYLPSGQYGPYTGNENISITYGAPQNTNTGYPQRPFYPKPFYSSPSDPYLNNYDNYNNFYNSPSYYNDMYNKYSDFYKNFYNKFDYNNYPSFYNNFLGKWN